ncbi:hypothetical protein Tsubulata_032875, partial [Turnera subulata]
KIMKAACLNDDTIPLTVKKATSQVSSNGPYLVVYRGNKSKGVLTLNAHTKLEVIILNSAAATWSHMDVRSLCGVLMRNIEMDSFNVEEDQISAKKRQNGSSWKRPPVDAQHRRSKSASERNLEISRAGVLHSIKKGQNETNMSPLPTFVYRAQSPLHHYPARVKDSTSSSQRASLEKDIEQLQLRLQEEKSMRLMLERAMGRVSSTLSPGHRHFATQTRELIAEIELLEEEVANREQHVLSLYRNIFENSVSRAPSQQSSGMSSPAHTKHTARKHPSIISSTFCSAKHFPLRPFQALVSMSDSGKKTSKANGTSILFSGKSQTHLHKTCPNQAKAHEKVLAHDSIPAVRTLKEHLHQCPSKLSEEMVRSMAAVYCWLRSTASVTSGKTRSPLLSKSSSNVVIPRRGIGESRSWSCKSMVEISWITTDKSQFSRASFAINNYRVLVEQLERVTVTQMENSAQLAFWINVYNALIMHVKYYMIMQAAYNIGGHIISANSIEQSIFGFHTPRVGKWLETILSTALRKKSGEEKQLISSKFGLPSPQPLACFALCTGAFSDPVLKVYTASGIIEELEAAKREFLQANVIVKKSRKVFLPKVLERFAKESSISSDDLLQWVTENVDKKLHDSIQKCIDRKSKKKVSHIVEWLPYSSSFRYVFAKELAEKPWWV